MLRLLNQNKPPENTHKKGRHVMSTFFIEAEYTDGKA